MALSARQAAASCSSLLVCPRSNAHSELGRRAGGSASLAPAPAQTSRSSRTFVACRCSSHPDGASARVNNIEVLGKHATRPIVPLSRQFQGLFLTEKLDEPVGSNMATHTSSPKGRCYRCAEKGAIQCLTCTGSGLYVDAILESQGIIVHVRCLGCGGSGEIMCPKCGGRGYI